MERLRERLEIATRALQTLLELAKLDQPTRVQRDAAIQRFEYTFEAAWKTAQRFLEVVEGRPVGSPKASVRASREVGLLGDEDAASALAMVDDRNLSVHTYDEAIANHIFSNLGGYCDVLERWR